MTFNMNKALPFFALILSVTIMLAFTPQQVDARNDNDNNNRNSNKNKNKNSNKNSNKNINANRNSNKNTNVNVNSNKNTNTNVNVNKNKNTNVNVDVDVNHKNNNNRGGAFVAGVATAIVVGAIVNSLPSGCNTVIKNGISYSQCGSTWYQPQQSGDSVTYIVVNAP